MHAVHAALLAALTLCTASACTSPPVAAAEGGGLKAFSSEAEFRRFARLMHKQEAGVDRLEEGAVLYDIAPAPPAPIVAEPAAAARAPSEQITNVQEAGVDEGGIVKVAGDYLVVLRRGRIFSVRHGGGALEPVDAIDAYPPDDTSPGDTWYDEMLVDGDQIVIIGYSYGGRGTEVSRFRLGANGRLSYRDTHYLSSGDYYSSSNYASRLIGDELVLYTPVYLHWGGWSESLPAIRDGAEGETKPLVDSTRFYVAEPYRGADYRIDTLHTVTRCDLSSADLDCTATAVAGSSSHSFYVAQDAVYVWTGEARPFDDRPGRKPVLGMLYRLPYADEAPGAVRVSGSPIDQFSFREDSDEGLLRVLLRDEGYGEGMWASEASAGDFALLDLPLRAFGDGSREADRAAYRHLPRAGGWRVQNRFVGQHLLYAAADYGRESQDPVLYAVPLAGGDSVRIALPHGVTRLDVLGSDGVAVGPGSDNALGFSAIRLDARSGDASLEDTYLLPAAREGEVRSQAFFYRPDRGSADGTSGTLGLPVSRELGRAGQEFLGSGSAITFLRRDARHLSPLGELVADDGRARPDNCQASCVDWYGNARPIFLGDRVFALMGYELVEGRAGGGRIAELRRIDFTPRMVLARGGD